MGMDRFEILSIADILYRNDLVKKLGLDSSSEYGIKTLNEYLLQERISDIESAKCYLKNNNPDRFVSAREVMYEADEIRNKRLEPYIQKATIIVQEREIRMNQEQSEQNIPVSASILLMADILYRNDLAQQLEIDLNSKNGRKILEEYLEKEKVSDVFSAMNYFNNNMPGEFITISEIKHEAEKIKNKRLEPYIQKALRIHQEQETQEQSGPVKKLIPPRNTRNK